VTNSPPRLANAWVQPTASFRWRGSGKSSDNHVTAATYSTQTPTKVVQRKKINHPRLVLSPARTGERE
jgi:hypothetical protein